MKKILLSVFVVCIYCFSYGQDAGAEPKPPVILSQAPAGQQGFTVNGDIANSKEGTKVWLYTDAVYPEQRGDSSVIKNGKFQLKGYVPQPVLAKVVIEVDDPKDSKEKLLLGSEFYLENTVITYAGDINTLETLYYNPDEKDKVSAVISGGKEDQLYRQFQKEYEPLSARGSAIFEKYYEVYGVDAYEKEKYNIEAGIPILKQVQESEEAIRNLRLKYIKQYPASSIAHAQLNLLLVNVIGINFTAKQLDQLQAHMVKANPDRKSELDKIFTQARKTAIGEKFTDLELLKPDGTKGKISDYVGIGKYVLLDFWFSECGPCRAENPQVKMAYNMYKDKGFEVVSISVEPEKEKWLKALKEDKMAWPQLYDRTEDLETNKAPTILNYNVVGFPTTLLLDREGRFLKTDVRGLSLIVALRELLGVPAKK